MCVICIWIKGEEVSDCEGDITVENREFNKKYKRLLLTLIQETTTVLTLLIIYPFKVKVIKQISWIHIFLAFVLVNKCLLAYMEGVSRRRFFHEKDFSWNDLRF